MTSAGPNCCPTRGLTGWIVRRLAPEGLDPHGTAVRTRLGEWEGYVSTAISILLAFTKAVLGAVSGSVSLIADSVNNLADVGSSLLIAISFRWSRRPRDAEHPYGHGRIEAVATLVLALFLLGIGVELARNGVRRLIWPQEVWVGGWILGAVAATVALKTWLAVFARAVARYTGSQVLEADAWNHFFDILSSLLVVIALLFVKIGQPRVDGFAAVGVALCIAYTGFRYAREAVNEILGRAPTADEMERLREVAMSEPGVCGVHDIIVHEYGDVRLVSLHIEVGAELTVMEAHRIAEHVETRIGEQLDAKAVVHVDPVDRSHPAYAQAERALRDHVAGSPDLVAYHDLRVTGPADRYAMSVDLVVRSGVQRSEFDGVLGKAQQRLHERLPGAERIELGVETEYASDPEYRRSFSRDELSRGTVDKARPD